MPMFETHYAIPARPSRVTTTVYAQDEAHLREVLRLRRMDEVAAANPFTQPPVMASTHLNNHRFAAANHALIWTSMIASKATLAEPWDLLHDEGLLHAMAHMMHQAEDPSRYSPVRQVEVLALAERIERFERRVPGVHPCWQFPDQVEPARPPAPARGAVVGRIEYATATGVQIEITTMRDLNRRYFTLGEIKPLPVLPTRMMRSAISDLDIKGIFAKYFEDLAGFAYSAERTAAALREFPLVEIAKAEIEFGPVAAPRPGKRGGEMASVEQGRRARMARLARQLTVLLDRNAANPSVADLTNG